MNKPRPQSGGGDGGEHPDIRSSARGRIPESLIEAAIDGELSPDLQKQIADALRYDPQRKRELLDTASALNALQFPVSSPDFTDAVLTRADHHRRFIPASWRRRVRAGRVAIAAGLLLALTGVAALQHAYPRLTTLAAHPTPVQDIQRAVEYDRDQLAQAVNREVRAIRSNVEPLTGLLVNPGRGDFNFDTSIAAPTLTTASFSQSNATVSRQRLNPGPAALYLTGHSDGANPPLGLITSAGWTYPTPGSTSEEPAELDVPDLP